MTDLLASGRLIDFIMIGLAGEALLLFFLHRRRGGWPWRDWLPSLLAGLCLMVALRIALSGLPVEWLMAALAGSGAAHAWDLSGRRRRADFG